MHALCELYSYPATIFLDAGNPPHLRLFLLFP